MTTVEAHAEEVTDEDSTERNPGAVVPYDRSRSALTQADELSVDQLLAQVRKVQEVMMRAMTKDVHYGVIPGVDKPSLFKPGAEKLCVVFRLDPEHEVTETRGDDSHLDVTVRCTLYHIPTGNRVASGVGSCSTRESKYALMNASRVCPACGKPAVIKGKPEYGGGWLCFKRKDGCGAKWADATEQGQAFQSQESGKRGRDENELADVYNTVLKMGAKRALIAAVLNATAASDIFTQDVEDTAAEPTPAEEMPRDEPPAASAAQETPKFQAPGGPRGSGVKASDKQIKMATDLIDWLGKNNHSAVADMDKFTAALKQEYGTSDLNELSGGKNGQISNLISRLKALKDAATA